MKYIFYECRNVLYEFIVVNDLLEERDNIMVMKN